MNLARSNPPATAGGIAAVVIALLGAFTSLSADQVAAIGAAVAFVAGVVAQRWTVPYLADDPGADEFGDA